jgi:predicted membrane chloride channel (bestrophin family)
VLLSYFLLGIEELGVQLEEPFSVLPLHKITSGIGLSAEEHVQWFLNDSAKSEMKTNSAGSASPNYQNLSP